jgi:predicted dehydrogenase
MASRARSRSRTHGKSGSRTRTPGVRRRSHATGSKPRRGSPRRSSTTAVRFAVVGLGHIAQAAVLPAFGHARGKARLAALVSDNPTKLKALSRRYDVPHTYTYDQYDECLRSGEVDAVYIALPNHLHKEYSVAAANAGVHVLCEKPMAVTVEDCEAMIRAAREHDVRLMIAYRLHFERGNLESVKLLKSRKLGEPRFFSSVFGMQVKAGDIRVRKEVGGGTLNDIGIYCINAARYLFRDEPMQVHAFTASNGEERFRDVEEMTGALLRFPGGRLATFVCSFGSADVAAYEVVGTKGSLRVENAYEYAEEMRQVVTVNGRRRERSFPKRDQFAPELIYFSDCVRQHREPEPSGIEGLIDVAIIQALYRSAETLKPVDVHVPRDEERPSLRQEIHAPPVEPEPELVGARSPTRE